MRINGGTLAYRAPELNKKGALFSKKADVFAAGIIFLELLSVKSPAGLYRSLWPSILQVDIPEALKKTLSDSLDEDPERRALFPELLSNLASDRGQDIKSLKLFSDSVEFNPVAADINSMLQSSFMESRGDTSLHKL